MMLLFPLIGASFLYVTEPFVNMREAPSKDSVLESQCYYSEPVAILEEGPEWLKIETTIDHSKGWIEKKHVFAQREEPFQSDVKVKRVAAHLYSEEDTEKGPILTLPYDGKLKVIDASGSRWIKVTAVDGSVGYIQRGDVEINPRLLNREEMCALSLQFLGLPYHWGGRSSISGFDCSGFVQMLYRQMGVNIPRNSRDQIQWDGFTPVSLDKMIPGDLVFFGLAEDKIRHVGMCLGNGTFIHATVAENSPYIRISELSHPEWNGQGRLHYVAGRTLKEKTP